ncbi:MAG: phosphate acyltransferase [Bacteroidales bacterium]|nr:phosphate acyltransferase [Bacteroidales bacterium]MCB9029118.1 phosphate acyltransferase [Bacteroidales bacterium]HOO66188.1 phosphate--acyl-ACP acyltransferase [Bacteroidales bacterium]HPE22603.1 phosphate--acyl-ACP acyltransferase [Bacteroidales bacterium]HPJ05162.1 phosphate--acyl-ACP acyltransferase [Bacteroidales bacterium]
MKIGLDAMGGDYAPNAVVEGAFDALGQLPSGDRIVLIGDNRRIREKLALLDADASLFEIVPTSQVIEMSDHPAKAFSQKRDSSIAVGFGLLKSGLIDGFASAGNTGAMMVGASYTVNVIPGVVRPALAALIPNVNGKSSIILDVGINPDSKPDVLLQYGMLGTVYARHVLGIDNPTVGLLNIGAEETKGSSAVKAAYELLNENSDIHFMGNIEGHQLFTDEMTDVIICDGFVGNVILKMAEKIYVVAHAKGIDDNFFNSLNFEVVGGTPVLGLNENVVVGHGISNRTAIMNMIFRTFDVVHADLAGKIREAFGA